MTAGLRGWAARWGAGFGVGYGVEECLPVRKHDVDSNGAQMLEKAVLSTAGRDGCFPAEARKLGSGVEGEGEEVKGNEEAGQSASAVPKVVLKVVATGL